MLMKEIESYDKIYLASGATDLRKSVDGLCNIIILYEYQPTCGGYHAKEFLTGFTGYLQTDGYAGYLTVPDVTHCGCWAHVRQKFEEALPKEEDKTQSKAYLGVVYCNKLFELEKNLTELTPKERHEKRQVLLKPAVDLFWTWLNTVSPLQGSALGKAVTYAYNQRPYLNAFLMDGHIALSNNRAENVIRPFVIGRKNWLFADTQNGAEASALAYSIIETAKANGLNVLKYLIFLFTYLPSIIVKNQMDKISDFFPWSYTLPDSCRLK